MNNGDLTICLIDAETHKVQKFNYFQTINAKEGEIALIGINGKGMNILFGNGKLVFDGEWPISAPVINREVIQFTFKDGSFKTFDLINFEIVD